MLANQNSEILIEFNDNNLLPLLFGKDDIHLKQFEKSLGVEINYRGNHLTIQGSADKLVIAENSLKSLYEKLKKDPNMSICEVDSVLKMAITQKNKDQKQSDISISTKLRNILPRSHQQREYMKLLKTHDMVFASGPAGTGKTYIAVGMAVSALISGQVSRIILSRPAVEAGESLGFLPGDMKEKVDPYLRPLYDALHDMLPNSEIERRMANGDIEIAPLAFMRGRTLSNAFIILDEAQNTTPVQMKMFLTRFGENSKMVITGDASQIDLPTQILSGLKDARKKLKDVEDVAFINFSHIDVVRHPLVTNIIKAYDSDNNQKN